MKCPEGMVFSEDIVSLTSAGYKELKIPNKCLPMPCKWFFSNDGTTRFNNNNFFIEVGCSCDVSSGWIPTISKQACVPLFANDQLLHHEAVSLQYASTPQTLHQYQEFKEINPLAKHIKSILLNSNTKDASKQFTYKEFDYIIAGEIGVNSFNSKSKSVKYFKRAATMHEALAGIYKAIDKFNKCADNKKDILCVENHYLMINEALAFQQAIGGVYWISNESDMNLTLLTSSNLYNIELKYNSR